MSEFREREFFDQLETMLPEKRKRYLNQKLGRIITLAYLRASSVKEILDRAGITPSQIRTVKDLEKLPITRKSELLQLQKSRPPYGGFETIPVGDVSRVYISPGPLYEPHLAENIKWFAKSFYAAGFRKGDIALNTFTYHMSPAGFIFHEALRACGATVVATGTSGTEAQIQTMRDLKVTAYVGTPSFLVAIIKKAESIGYSFRHDFALRHAWFSGEMLAPSTRRIFEEDYQISTAQTYALTELGGALAYECREKSGMHLNDDYVTEIVDPGTGEQLGVGDVGEIVVTPIINKTWCLIRYGTGDMASITDEPCRCGRTANRLVTIVGRADDAVKVRGMFVISKQTELVLSHFGQISRFQIVVERKAERDEMTLNVELKDEAMDKSKLENDLTKRFQDICRVRADRIQFVPKGTIPEEPKIIVDRRIWK